MQRVRSLGNGHILPDMDALNLPAIQAPWNLTLHLRARLQQPGQDRDYFSIHRIGRDETGRWHVTVERDNGEPTEMQGDGALPVIVEAHGAIVILLPPHDQDRPYPLATT